MKGQFLAGCAAVAIMFWPSLAAVADVMPNPALAGGVALANVTISVSNLEKSTRFYQALGFTVGDAHQPGVALAAKTLGVSPDSKLDIRFISRDGMYVELVQLTPAPIKPASIGSAGQLGLATLAFRVDDVTRVAALIKANGGAVLEETHATAGQPGHATEFLFCTDPDGVRLELVSLSKG